MESLFVKEKAGGWMPTGVRPPGPTASAFICQEQKTQGQKP